MSNFSPYPEGSECDPNCPWNAVEDDFEDDDDLCDECGAELEDGECAFCEDEDSGDDEV